MSSTRTAFPMSSLRSNYGAPNTRHPHSLRLLSTSSLHSISRRRALNAHQWQHPPKTRKLNASPSFLCPSPSPSHRSFFFGPALDSFALHFFSLSLSLQVYLFSHVLGFSLVATSILSSWYIVSFSVDGLDTTVPPYLGF